MDICGKHNTEMVVRKIRTGFDRLYCPECQSERIAELGAVNKALLDELKDAAWRLECLCGHPFCKECLANKHLTAFIALQEGEG